MLICMYHPVPVYLHVPTSTGLPECTILYWFTWMYHPVPIYIQYMFTCMYHLVPVYLHISSTCLPACVTVHLHVPSSNCLSACTVPVHLYVPSSTSLPVCIINYLFTCIRVRWDSWKKYRILPQLYLAVKFNFRNISLNKFFDPRPFW